METLINFKKLINPSIPIIKVLTKFIFTQLNPEEKRIAMLQHWPPVLNKLCFMNVLPRFIYIFSLHIQSIM